MAERIYILPIRENQEEAVWPSPAGISGREPQNTKPMAERAREVFKERAERAQDALRSARNQLAGNARTAMDRILRVAHERPFHLVAGIAGAAFALGVALRIWRSKQYG